MTCDCPLYAQHLNGNDSSRPLYCDVWTWRRLGNSISSLSLLFSPIFFVAALFVRFWSSCLHFLQLIGYDDDGFSLSVCACSRRFVDNAQTQFMVRSLAGYFMKLSIVIRRCTHQKPIRCTCVEMCDFSFVFQFKVSVHSTSFNGILMCRAVYCSYCLWLCLMLVVVWWWCRLFR